MITETDRVSRALEFAATLRPELRGDKGALLRLVLERGIEQFEREREETLTKRREAIERVAGSMSAVWPANWRDNLRSEWPA